MTDEELKKYGIHVASRLDEDDAVGGQNKWADIDDDDEDWNPDAITWTDGTKTALPHPDEPVAATTEIVPAPAPEKTRSPVPNPSTSALTKPGSLPSGRGLVLKSATQDKPTLVAKPPAAPTPAKSPWATLPPVQKASPGTEPHSTGARGPGQSQNAFAQRGPAPPIAAPKEIAADDFSRSLWREGSQNVNRELYNSQSGRYEPVPDRRGSLRADAIKQPSLLQRPSGVDQPAEPSTAFQTQRVSQDMPYRRRRGSSNVSGGSGSLYPRIGKNDGIPFDGVNGRRPSFAGSIDSPISSVALPAPGPGPSHGQQGWSSAKSPGSTFADPHHIDAPQPSVDDVEYQKKLMRERNELARKRRQEQEAAEEAARRERIQKKLEAMGPPPPKKSEMKDNCKVEESSKPTAIQQRGSQEIANRASDTGPQGLHTTTSPILANTSTSTASTSNTKQSRSPKAPTTRQSPHEEESNQGDLWTGSGPNPERFTWASQAVQAPSRNVWGSPDNDRGLGNGTFNPDLGLIPGSTAVAPPPAGKGPAPIGPPGGSRPVSSGRTSGQAPAPIGSRPSRYGPPGSDLASKWVTSVAETDKKLSAQRLAERAERERQLTERGLSLEDAQPVIKDTWRPVHVPGDGTRRAGNSADAGHAQPSSSNINGPGQWQASTDESSRNSHSKESPGVIGSGHSAPGSSPGGNSILTQPGQAPTSQSRLSRFFPARDARYDAYANHAMSGRPLSPSPPPPTLEDHPVYEGDITHPHVSLPKPQPVVKLPPAVLAAQQQQQLGKPLAWAQQTPFRDTTRGPGRNQTRRSGDTTQEDWQRKFNNLLGSSHAKFSPPKAIGVDPASRSSLDHMIHHDAATVSLPRSIEALNSILENSSSEGKTSISKPMAEECFDEQEMGSVPQVKIPRQIPEAAWHPAEAQTKPLPKKFLIHPTAVEVFRFPSDVVGSGNVIRIQFPGVSALKTVTLPFAASRGSRGHSRPGPRGRGGNRGNNRRDTSGSHDNTPAANHSGRGGRGSYRGRGTESRSRNAPPQQAAQV